MTGWMERLKIILYFYSCSQTWIILVYKKYLWAFWFSCSAMETTKTRLSAKHETMSVFCFRRGKDIYLQELIEQFSADTTLFIADKEWNRWGYIYSFCTCHQLSSPVVKEVWKKMGSMSFPFFVKKQALRNSYRFWGDCSKFTNSC